MLSKVNGVVWMEEGGVGGAEDDEDAVSWTRGHGGGGSGGEGGGAGLELGEGKDELGLATFKSMLEDDWFLAATAGTSGQGEPAGHAAAHQGFDALQPHQHHQQQDIKDVGFSGNPSPAETMLLQATVDSSSSCSPSSVFSLDPCQPFFPQKSALSSLLNAVCSNPFDAAAFDLGCDASGFLVGASQISNSPGLLNRGSGSLGGNGAAGGGVLGFGGMAPCGPMGSPDLCPTAQFQSTRLMPLPESSGAAASFSPTMGFGVFDNSPFLNRSKVLRPLEIFPPVGAQPTLFQKRAAALRQNSAVGSPGTIALSENAVSLGGFIGQESAGVASHRSGAIVVEEHEKRKRGDEEEDMDEASIDGSGLNYDSDDVVAEAVKVEDSMKAGGGGNTSNANSTVTGGGGDQKGKKKGLPAKNLMAERRRRKKLNDRLYMLRSVVPKITKMDRASILGDAIEYLKELLQRINDLHNELESTPSGSSLPSTTTTAPSFHPLTPTPPTLPCRVKEELCPSSLPSPNSQLPRVEVREREGRAVNIHMFCARRPGLLLSTMRALDSLGLDIQQAVISCFNGFALDVFRAEQCKDGPGVRAEEIKAVLLHSAGCHGPM